MKQPFLHPTFDGARFVEHTLPIELARDMVAYEKLVIELARHLYLEANTHRQRVPKGFDADFQLHIETIEEGSTKPLLSMVVAGVLALHGGDGNYFERSRDVISDCIAAPVDQLPAAFPRQLLSYFNQIGRSLQPGESMQFPIEGRQPAVLTPEKRKALVLAAELVYEREVELKGTIEEADWERSTFRLRQSTGVRMVIPMESKFHDEARRLGGHTQHQVTMKGVGAFDSWDNLQKITSVESLAVQRFYMLADKFDEISSLAPGWLDGEGEALDSEKLNEVATKIVETFPENIPLPAVVPTPEGGLLLEWDVEGDPSVDIRLADLHAMFHAFDRDGGDLERNFDLTAAPNWAALMDFLAHNIGPTV